MKKNSSDSTSRTNWARVDALTDEGIDTSDVPALGEEFFSQAKWLKPPDFPRLKQDQAEKEALVGRLEQALTDVGVIRDRWTAALDTKQITDELDAAFEKAHKRVADQSGVLAEDIAELTGVRGWDVGGGRHLDIFTAALSPNPMDAFPMGVTSRLRELMNVENLLRRAIGLAKAGRKYTPAIARLGGGEEVTNEFERARDEILQVIFAGRDRAAYIESQELAGRLRRPHQDVRDDLDILEAGGYVRLGKPMGADSSWTVELTVQGMQRAREGKIASSALAQSQVFNIYAQSTINAAQTSSGDISQVIVPATDLSQVRVLASELRKAIESLEASAEERNTLGAPIRELESELQKPEPLLAGIMNGLSVVKGIATAEGAWQGWDRAQRIAVELAPHLAALMQSLQKA
jgi:hypothetical protein